MLISYTILVKAGLNPKAINQGIMRFIKITTRCHPRGGEDPVLEAEM